MSPREEGCQCANASGGLFLLPPTLAHYPERLAVDNRCRNVGRIADRVGVDVARVLRDLFPSLDVKLHRLACRSDVCSYNPWRVIR